jgi:prepilin-type processing-associated H-X9-DG protein
MQRVRSVSMNGYVNGYQGDLTPVAGWNMYRKLSDVTNPRPSDLWVFVDEHPDSINDGWLIVSWAMAGDWSDMPASYHNGGCGFGFADGHSQTHRWRDAGTLMPVRKVTYAGDHFGGSDDLPWAILHTSATTPYAY